jgi:hypothetical protein
MGDNVIPSPPAPSPPGVWTTGKPAWQSKAMWASAIVIVLAGCSFSDQYFHTNITGSPLYKYALGLAGMFGLYGRASADSPITSVI